MVEDHRRLDFVVVRVRQAHGPDDLARALEELSGFLATHFEREERDQGIFGILGKGTSSAADALVEEHRLILAEIQALAVGVRQGMNGGAAAEKAAQVMKRLRDHERREHALAESLLGRKAQAVA